MARMQTLRDPHQEKVKRLEDDLWRARHTIVHMMREDLVDVLNSYYRCETLEEHDRWGAVAVAQLIEKAEPLPGPRSAYFPEERAQCPLCRSGSMSAYTEGFSLPEGLRRHLVGWGNASQCEVMAAASAMARDYFRSKFEPIERARDAEKLRQRKQREATERLYRTEPSGPGAIRQPHGARFGGHFQPHGATRFSGSWSHLQGGLRWIFSLMEPPDFQGHGATSRRLAG